MSAISEWSIGHSDNVRRWAPGMGPQALGMIDRRTYSWGMRIGTGRERPRCDGGAAALEYAALLVAASLVITMLLAFVPNPVEPEVKAALCRLFGGTDCKAESYVYKPPASACVVASDSAKAGASVTVFSVKVGTTSR